MSALAFHRVSFAYGAVSVLDGLDLTIDRSELVGLLGPNGVGKTTFVRLASGAVTVARLSDSSPLAECVVPPSCDLVTVDERGRARCLRRIAPATG